MYLEHLIGIPLIPYAIAIQTAIRIIIFGIETQKGKLFNLYKILRNHSDNPLIFKSIYYKGSVVFHGILIKSFLFHRAGHSVSQHINSLNHLTIM